MEVGPEEGAGVGGHRGCSSPNVQQAIWSIFGITGVYSLLRSPSAPGAFSPTRPHPHRPTIAHLKTRRCKIAKMLDIQGMKFEGRLHSGIDDSRNIARIAAKLIEDGSPMYINEGLPPRTAFRDL